MIKIQWDRYWEKEAPLLGEMMGFSEGDHSPLVAEYIHHNRKYTHHPIALAQDIHKDPSFRHLTLEEVVKAVYCNSRCRNGDYFGYEAIEVDPNATKYAVSIATGLCCLACNNMVFDGIGISEKNVFIDYDRFESTEIKIKKMYAEQRSILMIINNGFQELNYAIPLFCEDCFSNAKKHKLHYGYEYMSTNAVRDLLNILEGRIPNVH